MARADYDLAIIGAGAAGLIAARFAVKLGARVLLAERDRIGGDCTWTGCVPSKSLIRVAKAAHEIRTAGRFGIAGATGVVDMPRVHDYVQSKVQQIYQPTSPAALEREGIHVAMGPALFQNAHTLRIGERSVTARRYLVCTGATPVTPSIPGLDQTTHFTYHTIFDTTSLPASLIVIGGGPLGMELAQAFQRLGSQVTIVAPSLLPNDDPEASEILARVFQREGVRWLRGRATDVRDVRDAGQGGGSIRVRSESGEEVHAERLLVAAGRRPNVDGLALERAGVTHSDRGIPVDDRFRTNVPHIYAAGDVLGGKQFSHLAGWQAFRATRNALLPGSAARRPKPMSWATFTDPEVAQVGLTEAEAIARFGSGVRATRWQMTQVDRARCDDDENGFIKVMTTGDGRVVGATIVAARAGEVSTEFSLAIEHGLTAGQIGGTIHAYPTYGTGVQQLAGEIATGYFSSSTLGRIVRRWMNFRANRT